MNLFKSIFTFYMLLLLSGCEETEPLIVTTENSSTVSYESATINGSVMNTEKEVPVGFIYDTHDDLSENTGKKSATQLSSSSFSTNIENLLSDTTYYYRAYAIDQKGKFYFGNIKSFRTLKSPKVTTTTALFYQTMMTADLYGAITYDSNEVEVGFIYDNSNSISETKGHIIKTKSKGAYSLRIENLEYGTTYYYRAFAYVDGKYYLGEIKSFQTKEIIVETDDAHVYESLNKVVLSGKILNIYKDTKVGIVYNTSKDVSETKGKQLTKTSQGYFTFDVTTEDLKPGITYYFKAFAYVDGKYYWGEIKEFKTKAELIVKTTNEAILNDFNMSTYVHGIIINAEEEVEVGFIYDTSNNISETKGHKIKTKSKGAFYLNIENLEYGTTYYYRAFAYVNGKYYLGEIKSFQTKEIIVETRDAYVSELLKKVVLSGNSSNYKDTKVGIVYNTSNEVSETKGKQLATTSHGNFSFDVNIEDLKSGITYYFKAFAYANGKYYWGETKSFKIKAENSPNLEPGVEL